MINICSVFFFFLICRLGFHLLLRLEFWKTWVFLLHRYVLINTFFGFLFFFLLDNVIWM